MSDTYRWVHPNASDPEHWARFGIQSKKHQSKDRKSWGYKKLYDRWSKYSGRGFKYRQEQFRKLEEKNLINNKDN